MFSLLKHRSPETKKIRERFPCKNISSLLYHSYFVPVTSFFSQKALANTAAAKTVFAQQIKGNCYPFNQWLRCRLKSFHYPIAHKLRCLNKISLKYNLIQMRTVCN